jgi:hypothetical protein
MAAILFGCLTILASNIKSHEMTLRFQYIIIDYKVNSETLN